MGVLDNVIRFKEHERLQQAQNAKMITDAVGGFLEQRNTLAKMQLQKQKTEADLLEKGLEYKDGTLGYKEGILPIKALERKAEKAGYEEDIYEGELLKKHQAGEELSDAQKKKIGMFTPTVGVSRGNYKDLSDEQYFQGLALPRKEIGRMDKESTQELQKITLDLMKAGKTRDEILDSYRKAGYGPSSKGPGRAALQNVYAGKSEKIFNKDLDIYEDLLETGDTKAANNFIKRSARNIAGPTKSNEVQGKERLIELLEGMDKSLDELEKSGLSTNIFKGTKEQMLNKIGKISDPRLRALITTRSLALFGFLKAQSGVAVSEQEAKRVAAVFLKLTDEYDTNKATIGAFIKTIEEDVAKFYKLSMGKGHYDKLFPKDDNELETTKTQSFTVDGKTYNIPESEVEEFKKAMEL